MEAPCFRHFVLVDSVSFKAMFKLGFKVLILNRVSGFGEKGVRRAGETARP